jgi:serine/threonine protein phosphatase PrpC
LEENSDTGPVEGAGAALYPPLHWVSAAATHVGKVRSLNEDALLDNPEIGLWAVADGVGGASAGDRASSLIVERLAQIGSPSSGSGFLGEVCAELRGVNEILRREGAGQRTIASTVVVLLFFQHHFACAWAGDSRLYLRRDGTLRQISHDHSQVQQLVDEGSLTPEAARRHPLGNVISRAVGADDTLELSIVHERMYENDVFLLCSDGLTKTLDDDRIARLLEQPVAAAAGTLVRETLEYGAPDNVSVVVVQVVGERGQEVGAVA